MFAKSEKSKILLRTIPDSMMYSFLAVDHRRHRQSRGSYKMPKNDIEFAQRIMLILEHDVRERAEIDERIRVELETLAKLIDKAA